MSSKTFDELVPPEICFQIFTFLDFRYMMVQIPKVCSSWRSAIITRVHTIHIYPNVEQYIFQNSLFCDDQQNSLFDSIYNHDDEKDRHDLNIEKDIFPFISYLTKFISNHSMKISHLFIHGDLKQSLLLYINSNLLYPSLQNGNEFKSRTQQESDRLLHLLNEYGDYFQNWNTWPLFNMYSNMDGTVPSAMMRLCDCTMSAILELLKTVSHSLKTLVVKNVQGNHHFVSQIQQCPQLKILVLEDVSRLYHLHVSGLRFVYCNENFYSTLSNNGNLQTPEYFHVNSNLVEIFDTCRHVSFRANSMSLIKLESFLKQHSNCIESAKIGICKNEYGMQDSITMNQLTKIAEKLMQCICLMPQLRRLDLSLDMVFDICMSHSIGSGGEEIFTITKDMDLTSLQSIKELRLDGISFLGTGFGVFLEKMIHLESLTCNLFSEWDGDLILHLLENHLKNLKCLELTISNHSCYPSLNYKLLKYLSQFLVNRHNSSEPYNTLTHIFIKNLNAQDDSKHLTDMLNDLYNHYEQNQQWEPSIQTLSTPRLHLGFQFQKKPLQAVLQGIISKFSQSTTIKIHLMESDNAIDAEPFIPFDIEYSLSRYSFEHSTPIEQLIEKRNKFKQLIASSKISCLECGMTLNRKFYEEHCQKFHYSRDLNHNSWSLTQNLDLQTYEIQCPSCHMDMQRCDFEEHVEKVCPRTRVKLPFQVERQALTSILLLED
ncbi:hypothetical protein C9374_002816 [Naegleria lovaniensis]|uniref:F-box domain-containing protein n=1 Tax=Naegleria lovaniensis TaxID=51637 RepID=A0AA88GT29_NAELO|nr:uncharacterized protein C9374_002816 [Naegleria lovaniensis]KAG2386370.1 hypothetical protein C9374_002816 [Naegleria lovaniensis]